MKGMVQPKPVIEPALVVILAGVSAALHVGKLPAALPVLREMLGISLLQAGFLLSLVQMAGMGLGVLVGLAADGWGLRRSMLTGLALLALASGLGGWADSAGWLMVLRALEGMGFLLASMPAPSLIRQLVPAARMSSMLGLWGAYMPLGTALALLLGPLVIGAWSWQVWWWLLAALSLVMLLWVAAVVPSDHTRGRAQAAAPWAQRLRLTLSSGGPWLVALCFAVYSAQWLAIIGFLPSIYAEAGFSQALTGVLTAAVAGVNMTGNVMSGRWLQRGVPAGRLLRIGYSVMGLGALLAFASVAGWAGPAWLRFVAVLLFSAVGGMIPGTLFSLAVRLSPSEGTVSTTVGWMQQWSSIGQFCGPPLVAWVAGRVGGWHWTWAVTGGCALAGLLLTAQITQMLALRARSAH